MEAVHWTHYVPSILSALGAGGIISFVTFLITRHDKKKEGTSAQYKMILGLGHDKILGQCEKYINRGYLSIDEYEDLNKYLYIPYKDMGGNGTVADMMDKVKQLVGRRPNEKAESED